MPQNKCPSVGGQAVLEGVMMRSPKCLAVAVRRATGEIALKESAWHSIWDRLPFLRWPFLRGTVVMIEAMVNGFQALNFSAQEAALDEEKEGNEAETKNKKEGGLSFALALVLALVVFIGLFKMLPHLAATFAGNLLLERPLTVDDTLYHIVDGIVKIAIFLAYIAVIRMFKDIKRVFMYHGAEHMAIYTLEAGEELTPENARRKSTLHPRCGTAFLMVVILFFIIVAALSMPFLPAWAKPEPGGPWFRHVIVVLCKLPLLIPVAGLAYEFNRFAGRHAGNPLLKPLLLPGLGMQLLTTSKPSDDQLEIALVALKTALKREKEGAGQILSDELRVFENFGAFERDFAAINSCATTP